MQRTLRKNLLVVLVFWLAAGPLASGRVIYVDDDAPAPGDGASWATAHRFLQDALTDAVAAQEPVEIRVARGLYKADQCAACPQGTGDSLAAFELLDGLSLLGGYAGVGADDPSVRSFEACEVILSGDLAGDDVEVRDVTLLQDDATRNENTRVVVSVDGDCVLLEGFTITGAIRSGVEIPGGTSDTIVRNCLFRANRGNKVDANASGGALTAYGEGLLVVRCSFVGNAGNKGAVRADGQFFEDCLFTGNYGWGAGGGGAGRQYGGTFTDCVFTNNRAERSGGALYIHGGDCTLRRCIFRGNVAEAWGGAIVCEGDMDMAACSLIGNLARAGGGAVVHSRGHAIIASCLFAGNWTGESGGACFAGWKSTLTVVGCTVTENRSARGAFLGVDHNTEETDRHTVVSNCVLLNGGDEVWTNAVPVEISYTCAAQGVVTLNDADGWVMLGPGNVEDDCCIANPGYWDSSGTPDDPNDDVFVEGDYHLKSQAGRWDPRQVEAGCRTT